MSTTLSKDLPTLDNLTPELLKIHWKQDKYKEEQQVIGFYQQKHPYFGCFSNFKKLPKYNFDLPYDKLEIPIENRKLFPSPVSCTNSEKSIMLCKAALMGDHIIYQQIINSENPKEIKILGRRVKPFDQDKFNKYVCIIALEAVYQKFSKGPEEIRTYLKLTNNAILAEAAYRDKNWGIGFGVNQYISKPFEWNGNNILGWVLMQTRFMLFS